MKPKGKKSALIPSKIKEKRDAQNQDLDPKKFQKTQMFVEKDYISPPMKLKQAAKNMDNLFKNVVSVGQEKAMEMMMENKDMLNVQGTNGETAIILAIEQGWIKLASKLLQTGADPTISDNKGKNAISVAIGNKDFSTINLLLRYWEKQFKHNSDDEFVDDRGFNLLMLAVEVNWLSGVEYFLNLSNIDHESLEGETALMLAAMKGNFPFVQLLFEYSDNVLLESKARMTAICYSIINKHGEICHFFFQNVDENTKSAFVQNRLVYLYDSTDTEDFTSFLKDVLFKVIFEIRRNLPGGSQLLSEFNIFKRLVRCGENYILHQSFLQTVLQFLACLLYDKADYSKYIDVKFAEDFVDSKGVEFILKVLRRHEKDRNVKCSALLSIHAVIESEGGKEWIKKNAAVLLPHLVEYNKNGHKIDYWMEGQGIKADVLWERFKDSFKELTDIDIKVVSQSKPVQHSRKQIFTIRNRLSNSLRYTSLRSDDSIDFEEGEEVKEDEENLFGEEETNRFSNPSEVVSGTEKKFDYIFDPYTGYNIGPANQISEGEDDFQIVTSRKMKQKIKKHEKRSNGEDSNRSRQNSSKKNKKNKGSKAEEVKISVKETIADSNVSEKSFTRGMDFDDSFLREMLEGDSPNRSTVGSGQEEALSCHESDSSSLSDSNPHVTSTPIPSTQSPSSSLQSSMDEASMGGGVTHPHPHHHQHVRPQLSKTEDPPALPQNPNVPNIHPSDIMLQVLSGLFKNLVRNAPTPDRGDKIISEKRDSKATIDDNNNRFHHHEDTSREEDPGAGGDGDETGLNVSWEPTSKRRAEALRRLALGSNSHPTRHLGNFLFSEEFPLMVGTFKSDFVGLSLAGKEVVIKQMAHSALDRSTIAAMVKKIKEGSRGGHKNVLPFCGAFVSDSFLYLVNGLCEFNLSEYFQMINLEGLVDISKNLVSQVLNGLAYLHDQRPAPILHGRLKPSNVLISHNGRLVLSDFGLLDIFPPLGGVVEDSPLVDDAVWRPQECLNVTSRDAARRAYTRASDVQVAGMVVHYILTGGKHPFGRTLSDCQLNISRHLLTYLEELGMEGNDLVRSLLTFAPDARPTARASCKHPFLLYPDQKVHFLATCLRQPEFESTHGLEICPDKFLSDTDLRDLEVDASIVQGLSHRFPFEKTALDLLCLILNCVKRFDGVVFANRTLQSTPAVFYVERYPQLLLAVRKIVFESSWRYRKGLVDYF